MSDKRKVKITNILESQIPGFLSSESPLFKEFLTQYYISQEHKTGTIDISASISDYKNINTYTNKTFYTKNNPCILSEDVLIFDTEIKVNSVIGFPDQYGLLKIDNEIITYTKLDKINNIFLGCIRGFSGVSSIEDGETSESLTFSITDTAEHSKNTEIINLNILFYEKLFDKFKSQYLPDFEGRDFYSGVDLELILSRAKDFYLSKGTDVSYKILFEILYGSKISVRKPKDFTIKLSDDRYLSTKSILVEKISGDFNPLNLIGYTIFQKTSDGVLASASIYNVEYRPIGGMNLFEILLDSESFIYELETTKKSNIVEITTETIIVDSTIGFPNSGNVLVKLSNFDSYINDSYVDKTVREFIGFSSQTLSNATKNDFILLDNLAYCILDDGSRVTFRILNVISDFNYEETQYLNVGDTINLSSFGEDLSDDIRFNTWIYNYPTYHKIKSIDVNNKIIEFYDSIKFYPNDYIELLGLTSSEICKVNTIIDDKRISIVSVNNLLDKIKIKKVINKSPANPSFISNIQNSYLNEDENSLIISTSGLPPYGDIGNFTINDWTYTLTSTAGTGTTDILNTNKDHHFLTGNKLYLNSNQVGISTGNYFIKKIDTDKLQLFYSISDLYQNQNSILFNVYNIGVAKAFGYENLNKGLTTQKILKEFKRYDRLMVASLIAPESPELP